MVNLVLQLALGLAAKQLEKRVTKVFSKAIEGETPDKVANPKGDYQKMIVHFDKGFKLLEKLAKRSKNKTDDKLIKPFVAIFDTLKTHTKEAIEK